MGGKLYAADKLSGCKMRGGLVVVLLTVVGLVSTFGSSRADDVDPAASEGVLDTMQSSRNENSTPRESILPFSPAIAGHRQADEVDIVLRSKAILTKLGYDVGRFDEKTSAKLAAAVYRFQKARSLHPSGRLDAATLNKLGIMQK